MTILGQLNSCLLFMEGILKADDKQNALMMKANTVDQVKILTLEHHTSILEPCQEADLAFSTADDTHRKYGQLTCPTLPDPSKCHATGSGLETAIMGEKSTAFLETVNFKCKPCREPLASLKCKLLSQKTGSKSNCTITRVQPNRYEISYQAFVEGINWLHIKVEGHHVRGSPFMVNVRLPKVMVGEPWGVAVTQQCQQSEHKLVVTDGEKHCVFVFEPGGKELLSFGEKGSDLGQFCNPRGVAVDCNNNIILVADSGNCRIQKFTIDGCFVATVGTKGAGPLQFSCPVDVAFSPLNSDNSVCPGQRK